MTRRAASPTPHPVDLHVGERLLQRRLALGLDAGDLDAVTGEPSGTVDKFERGVKTVGAHQLFGLARALEVGTSFFFEGMEKDFHDRPTLAPDPETVSTATQFLLAYLGIADAALRRGMYDLVKSVAEDQLPLAQLPATPERSVDLPLVEAALEGSGMICLGGFHPRRGDGVPGGGATMMLIGNAGPPMWEAFAAARVEEPDPMDSWTRRVLTPAAADLEARVMFPFDGPPYLPFQKWAQRAAPVFASPIGAFVHAEYGLWHAYRGAFVFDDRLDLPPGKRQRNPCEACPDKACLSACPMQAFKPDGYDVAACVSHLTSDAGGDCMNRGCQSRHACPVGQNYAPTSEQARFHMDRFVAKRRS